MSIRFVQITDIHLPGPKNFRLYNIPVADILEAIVNDIKNNESCYDFVLLTGDLTDTGEEYLYLILSDMLSTLSIPSYWLPGNHDNVETMQKIADKLYIKNCNSFSYNSNHVILLNSVIKDIDGENRARGLLTINELIFLEEELSQNPAKSCIIALHHPPIFSGTWKDDKMLINYQDFFNIIDKFQNTKLVIYGHQHQAFKATRNNVHFYSPPAASFQFHKEIKWAFEDALPGYGVIEINESGDIYCTDKRVDFKIYPVYNK